MIITTIKLALIHILLLFTTLVPQKSLMFGYTEHPKSLLPSEATSDAEKSISRLIFRQLYKYEDGELKKDLVKDVTISDDNKTYIISIKTGQHWQDGTEITSNDVMYSLVKYDSFVKNMSIEKTGKYEIKLTLSTPIRIMASFLTIGIEPSHIKHNPKLQPIGSTSFYVSNVSKEQNKVKSITLQSFKRNKPFNRVKFMFYDKEEDLKTAYKLGEINAFTSNRTYSFSQGLTHTPIVYLGRQYTIIFNTTSDKVKDSEIRKKLAQMLDTQSLLQTKHFFENNLIAEGPISHSVYTKDIFKKPLHDPNIKLTENESKDLDELVFLIPNNDEGEQIKGFVEESWGKKNQINIIFEFLDLKELLQRIHDGSFDVAFIGIETTPDPDRYTYWHSTQIKNGLNLAHFEDPRSDKALVEGRQTTDIKQRMKHYNIFQDVIFTKTPAIFLYHPGSILYTSDKIKIQLPKMLYYPADIFQNL